MATTSAPTRRAVKEFLRHILPLPVRQALAARLGRRGTWPGRYWWCMDLLRDWADRDPDAFHRFLWRHHLGYAETYEVEQRFGPDRVHPSRNLLFVDLAAWLEAAGRPPSQVRSVFEVGCSLGHLLRHLETHLFEFAPVLEGVDIDARAVERGREHLSRLGSKVRIRVGDMADLERHFSLPGYDVILCAGVLMYLTQAEAERVVRTIIRHTGTVAVFAGLAHPEADNASLEGSTERQRDGTWIHNIDAMVSRAGGVVAWRRWEGPRAVEGNTIYFVLATPGT
ncbi:MAG: class I SAM-dependent methyltransferase [Actinomycetota bacterium]